MFERLGIDVVMSAHGAAIRSVLRDVIDPRNQIRAELEHGDVHVIEIGCRSIFRPLRSSGFGSRILPSLGQSYEVVGLLLLEGEPSLLL